MDDVENAVLSYSVNVERSYDPAVVGGSYTLWDLTSIVTDLLVDLALGLCSLPYVAAFFYGLGVLTLLCVQCKQDRERRERLQQAVVVRRQMMNAVAELTAGGGSGSDASGDAGATESVFASGEEPLLVGDIDRSMETALRRAALVHRADGACGRHLTRAGCVFGYCGAFVMAATGAAFMTAAAVLLDASAVYVVAPHEVPATLHVAVEAGATNISAAEVQNITAAVGVCVLGDSGGSAAAAAAHFGCVRALM